jgi:hypothetical protein
MESWPRWRREGTEDGPLVRTIPSKLGDSCGDGPAEDRA